MGFGAAPVCSETFTMAEDPKASAVGEKFPFKGREGGIVLKILAKIVPPQRCFPPFFVSLSLSLRGRKVMTLPRLLSRKMCDLIFSAVLSFSEIFRHVVCNLF